MRILFWSLTFWPNIGGMEVLAARLLPCLKARGHDILVVAPKNYTDLPDQDRYEGIPVLRLPFQHAIAPTVDHIAEVKAQVTRIKRAFAADLVHINGIGAMTFFHLLTADVQRAPALVTLHGDWGTQGDSLAGQVLRSADWVVGCSASILERGRRIAPVITDRSCVIYNGIDAAVPDYPAVDVPRLLYVGRLAHEKGADLAVEAFGLVRSRVPGARLTIAGDGPMRRQLELRAATLGVRDAIDFRGWVLPDRVTSLIGEHAVVIMPSRQDSFPLVALETGAARRPLVATCVGGLSEVVVHEKTGLMVDAGDVRGLADAAASLLAQPTTAIRMGRAARVRVETLFSWRGHVARYDRLYRSLVGEPTSERRVAHA